MTAVGSAAGHRALPSEPRPACAPRTNGPTASRKPRPPLPTPRTAAARAGRDRRSFDGRSRPASRRRTSTCRSAVVSLPVRPHHGGRCPPTSRRRAGSVRSSVAGVTMAWSGSSTTGCADRSARSWGGFTAAFLARFPDASTTSAYVPASRTTSPSWCSAPKTQGGYGTTSTTPTSRSLPVSTPPVPSPVIAGRGSGVASATCGWAASRLRPRAGPGRGASAVVAGWRVRSRTGR